MLALSGLAGKSLVLFEYMVGGYKYEDS